MTSTSKFPLPKTINFNLILIFSFNFKIKIYVKTRLVTKARKNIDLPSAHYLYTSQNITNISPMMIPRGSKNVAG